MAAAFPLWGLGGLACGRYTIHYLISMTIFDPIRKKQVAATPEEDVRQHLVHYLHNQKGVPLSLIMTEGTLVLNKMQRRYDVAVFDSNCRPLLIAECKAPHIAVKHSAIEQAAIYNIVLHAPYLLATNGTQTCCCRIDFDRHKIVFLETIPDYTEMLQV
jgi:hypothetical protein